MTLTAREMAIYNMGVLSSIPDPKVCMKKFDIICNVLKMDRQVGSNLVGEVTESVGQFLHALDMAKENLGKDNDSFDREGGR